MIFNNNMKKKQKKYARTIRSCQQRFGEKRAEYEYALQSK